MATPGQLVQVMADLLGIPKATVTQYDRVLAEEGLRSTGGRGTSAAKVNSRDAANLLIALAVSPIMGSSAKDAVANCEAYASLRSLKLLNGAEDFAEFGLPTLAGLPKGHSFGEALSALMDAAGNGEVFKLPGGKRHLPLTSFEIRFSGPHPRAEIIVDRSQDFGLVAKLIYCKSRKIRKFPDLRRISTVGFRTILSLGSLIWDSRK